MSTATTSTGAALGPRNDNGSYHVTKFDTERGMKLSVGLVYNTDDGWVAYANEEARIVGLRTRADAVMAVGLLDRLSRKDA